MSFHYMECYVITEMKHFSVFKNYKPGEPTSRLYLKNLAKHATEQVNRE